MYIGKIPTVGNFQICDAISVVDAQAAYTMQVATVDVFPESANHMLVSLNGILQAPTSSFTVSGSTITFASALETGDVIDFIQILGNVLDLGVPSDNTVTTAKLAVQTSSSVSLAKLTATGTKDATTFLRGDNTFAEVPAGGLTLIKTQTVSSNVSSVDFVNGTGGCVIDSTYEYYIVRFSGVRFNSQGGLAGRLGTSGGFISASDYHQNEAMLLSNGSAWVLNQEETKNSFRITDRRYTNTTAGFSVNGEVRFYNMSSTSLYKAYWMEAVGFGNNASEVSYIVGSGMLEDSTSKDAANDRIQFLPLTASSIASGSFTLYGVKK
jgi:hypothetical protein